MNRKLLAGLAIVMMALALVGVVLAQVSGNFDLSWNLISGGGGTRQSANYQVQDSLGLVALDSSTSANYGVDSGFWIAAQPGVFITPAAALLRPGQTQIFEASGGIGTYSWAGTGGVITPTTGAMVTYTASDQKGDFNVIVTSGEAQATADVTIAGLDIVALSSTQVNVNDTVMFEITNPAENTAPFSWFSTNTDVGTILPVGGGTQAELTAKAVGVTEVYAQDHVGIESNRIRVIVGNTVEIPRVIGEAGKPAVVHINANTSFAQDITSLQMTILFDPALLQAQQAKVTYRSANFSLGASFDNGAGSATILLTSLTGEKISTGSGPILDLVLGVDAGATEGMTSTLAFDNITMVPLFGSPVPVTTLDGLLEVCPSCLIHDGDVDQNGTVNVADLQTAINIYLQRYTPNGEEFAAADMSPAPTGDGLVNVVDVLKILNKILGKPTKFQVMDATDSHVPVELTVPAEISAKAGEALVVPVYMENDVPVGGINITLVYTQVAEAAGAPSVSSPRGAHLGTLQINADNEGFLPILLRSPDTVKVVPAGSGFVFNIDLGTVSGDVSGKVTVIEAAVSDVNGDAIGFVIKEAEQPTIYLPLVVRNG